jgi:hypothetical protein
MVLGQRGRCWPVTRHTFFQSFLYALNGSLARARCASGKRLSAEMAAQTLGSAQIERRMARTVRNLARFSK